MQPSPATRANPVIGTRDARLPSVYQALPERFTIAAGIAAYPAPLARTNLEKRQDAFGQPLQRLNTRCETLEFQVSLVPPGSIPDGKIHVKVRGLTSHTRFEMVLGRAEDGRYVAYTHADYLVGGSRERPTLREMSIEIDPRTERWQVRVYQTFEWREHAGGPAGGWGAGAYSSQLISGEVPHA